MKNVKDFLVLPQGAIVRYAFKLLGSFATVGKSGEGAYIVPKNKNTIPNRTRKRSMALLLRFFS